jgi:hypothetical protein
LVLQYSTAPASSSISTSAALDVLGAKHKEARPMEASQPWILKVSLSETGTPCRGPRGGFPEARCASRVEARCRADVKRISVRQVVSWWAIAALCFQMVYIRSRTWSV